LAHRNSIGLLKVGSHQRCKQFVRVIIRFLGLVVVMLFSFPSPIGTQFSNAVPSATTDSAEVTIDIQRSGYLGFSRVHTPSRWTSSGSSTSEACSSFPAGSTGIFKFCGSPRTARREVCPSSKPCQWILHWPCHFSAPADVFVDGPRTTSYVFGCIRLPTTPGITGVNYSALSPCRCFPSTGTATTLKWENRPAPSNYMPFSNCPGAHGTTQNILGCSV
jgi:hypothetical protein